MSIALVPNVNRFLPSVCASSVTPPVSVLTPSPAFTIAASVRLSTWLIAIERPIEIATPVEPPSPAAIEAAPTSALIPDWSVAVASRLATWIPVAPSPSIFALTSVAIRFSA